MTELSINQRLSIAKKSHGQLFLVPVETAKNSPSIHIHRWGSKEPSADGSGMNWIPIDQQWKGIRSSARQVLPDAHTVALSLADRKRERESIVRRDLIARIVPSRTRP